MIKTTETIKRQNKTKKRSPQKSVHPSQHAIPPTAARLIKGDTGRQVVCTDMTQLNKFTKRQINKRTQQQSKRGASKPTCHTSHSN